MNENEKAKKRINITVDAKFHYKLKVKAAEQSTTMTEYILMAVNEQMKKDESEKGV